MFCTACGTRNIETSNFCKQCGHKLDHAAAPKISEEAFDRALPLEEQVTALMERAYRLRKTGELSSAVRICEEALQLNPASTSVHSLLGQIHEQMGNRDAAIHEYERVLQLNPGSIADRVKLDELRGDGLPSPLHPRSAPHIVMANHSLPNPSGRQMLGIAGIAGVLMLLGGLIALQYRTNQDAKNSTLAADNSRRMPGIPASTQQADPRAVGAAPTGANNAPEGANTGNTGALAQSGAGQPNNPNNPAKPTAPTNYPPQQIKYVEVPGRPVPVYIQGPGPTPAGRTNGALPNMPKAHSTASTGDDSEDVHLPDSGGERVHINISDSKGAEKNLPGVGSKGTSTSAKGTDTPRMQIKINPPSGNENNNTPLSAPSSTEAQSLIAIASDKFKNGDYEGAIKNYRRAVSGAGSQTASVYQQMGICYQRIKDKANAISNFNTAIAEYNKLVQANQQVDLARIGIRVCENGIKLCNAE